MMYSIGSTNGTQAVPYDFEIGAPSISINGARLLRRGRSPDRPAGCGRNMCRIKRLRLPAVFKSALCAGAFQKHGPRDDLGIVPYILLGWRFIKTLGTAHRPFPTIDSGNVMIYRGNTVTKSFCRGRSPDRPAGCGRNMSKKMCAYMRYLSLRYVRGHSKNMGLGTIWGSSPTFC